MEKVKVFLCVCVPNSQRCDSVHRCASSAHRCSQRLSNIRTVVSGGVPSGFSIGIRWDVSTEVQVQKVLYEIPLGNHKLKPEKRAASTEFSATNLRQN